MDQNRLHSGLEVRLSCTRLTRFPWAYVLKYQVGGESDLCSADSCVRGAAEVSEPGFVDLSARNMGLEDQWKIENVGVGPLGNG